MYNKNSGKWERKTLYYKTDNGEFLEAWTLLNSRNYELFGKLAGIRSIEEPFVYPRGLPDDLSDEVKKEYGNGEWYFGETWYDYCELNLYADTNKAFENEEVYDADNGTYYVTNKYNVVRPFIDTIDMILEAYGIYYPKPGEVRIVIWFDN